ncbi:DUF3459 domain-containing protein [Pendulispora albinea]|uniref:Alpha-glucosidase C-terminal domain-containing protein n=1 Tax=Pendulispora albinea TaxID=2741071 RepID=A0ABZ2LZ33_9BACT
MSPITVGRSGPSAARTKSASPASSDPALAVGSKRLLASSDDVLVYERTEQASRLLVALNFSAEERAADLAGKSGVVLLSTYLDHRGDVVQGELRLRANEGVLVELAP